MPTIQTLNQVENWLALLSVGATAGLALRLGREKLHRIYPFFFAWLLAEVLRAAILLPLKPRRTLYGWTYVFSEPVIWLLYFLIVWELYSIVLRSHPGIARAGKRIMLLAMTAALVLVAVSLQSDLSNPGQPFPILLFVHVGGRAVVSTLGVFLLLVTLLLVRFPIRLSRNAVYYCIGYAVFFCVKTAVLLCRNIFGPEVAQYASMVNLLVANMCMGFWLWKLSAAGEGTPSPLVHRWSPSEANRLLGQLKHINDVLSELPRKRSPHA
jgi:hypothetical protein